MAGKGEGACFDVNGGVGPDVGLWACHGAESPDVTHQQFKYVGKGRGEGGRGREKGGGGREKQGETK